MFTTMIEIYTGSKQTKKQWSWYKEKDEQQWGGETRLGSSEFEEPFSLPPSPFLPSNHLYPFNSLSMST